MLWLMLGERKTGTAASASCESLAAPALTGDPVGGAGASPPGSMAFSRRRTDDADTFRTEPESLIYSLAPAHPDGFGSLRVFGPDGPPADPELKKEEISAVR